MASVENPHQRRERERDHHHSVCVCVCVGVCVCVLGGGRERVNALREGEYKKEKKKKASVRTICRVCVSECVCARACVCFSWPLRKVRDLPAAPEAPIQPLCVPSRRDSAFRRLPPSTCDQLPGCNSAARAGIGLLPLRFTDPTDHTHAHATSVLS